MEKKLLLQLLKKHHRDTEHEQNNGINSVIEKC